MPFSFVDIVLLFQVCLDEFFYLACNGWKDFELELIIYIDCLFGDSTADEGRRLS